MDGWMDGRTDEREGGQTGVSVCGSVDDHFSICLASTIGLETTLP